MKKFQQGFTFIELTIIVAIIGILAVSIPAHSARVLEAGVARMQPSATLNATVAPPATHGNTKAPPREGLFF